LTGLAILQDLDIVEMALKCPRLKGVDRYDSFRVEGLDELDEVLDVDVPAGVGWHKVAVDLGHSFLEFDSIGIFQVAHPVGIEASA
jgi:hypothetical protein